MGNGDWNGIPLRGLPGSGTQSGTAHGTYYYTKAGQKRGDGGVSPGGELQIIIYPLQDSFINGKHVTLWDEPPANLKAPNFHSSIPEGATFDPASGRVTIPGIPDEPAAWKQVDMIAHTPGWTQSPQDPNAKYVTGFDGAGDPVFGDPPASEIPAGGWSSDTMFGKAPDAFSAFRQAMANPAALSAMGVPAGSPFGDKAATFIAKVLSAAKDFIG